MGIANLFTITAENVIKRFYSYFKR